MATSACRLQSRARRGAGAADRDRRGVAGHQLLARRSRPGIRRDARKGDTPARAIRLRPTGVKITAALGGERRLWVDGGPSFIGRTAVCGKPSFNYLVGESHQVGGDLKTERSGGLKIHDQLKFGGLLDRQVARLRTLEDFVNEAGGPVIQVREAWPVAQQAPNINELARYVDSRQ